MGCLFSRKKSHSDYHASERGYISRVDVHSPLSGSYANGDSYASHRSYTTGSWSTVPSRSSTGTKKGNWASTEGYSAGGVNTKRYTADSVMKSASNDLYIKSTSSTGFATATAASVDLESNRAYVAPAVRSAAERNCTTRRAKPVFSKSHVPPDKCRSASINVSSDGSYPTGRWSSETSRSSTTTNDVDRASSGYSRINLYAIDGVINSASNKRYTNQDVKSSLPKSRAAAAASVELESNETRLAPGVLSAAERNRSTGSVKPVSVDNCKSASIDVSSSASKRMRIMATYITDGGGKVAISVPLNPWKVLGLHSSGDSHKAVNAAFKMKITQPVRQNRAMISIAYHMLTSSAGRYKRIHGTDEFLVGRRDHFMLAACGHTEELALMIAKNANLVEERDEQNRTLLYMACRSGFYDTCKLLLQKGASVNETQRDGSTPLHGAAYFGHALVVGLLLQYGARSDISNKWGTAQDESATPMIRSLIQTASVDSISSLTAKLRVKQLVLNVRLIEYGGEVIAKELTRDPSTLDARTRAEWNGIQSNWEPAWHGTRYKYLEAIIEKGLLPAGSSGIKPMNGHISLGKTYLGISNWAAAIFVSPSILYAAHAVYSDRIFSESQQWCVLVKVCCKPGSYTSHDPTVIKYDPMDGEPENVEYRVPVTEADKNVILRVESTRNIVVRSLMFVRLNFLENQDMNFGKAMKLLR